MDEKCCYCKSKIGPKYNNEIYTINSKIYCSTGCYFDSVKEWKDEALKTYGEDLKKSQKNIVTKNNQLEKKIKVIIKKLPRTKLNFSKKEWHEMANNVTIKKSEKKKK